MGRNLVETVMGGVVLLVAGLFVYFAYTTAEVATVEGYGRGDPVSLVARQTTVRHCA